MQSTDIKTLTSTMILMQRAFADIANIDSGVNTLERFMHQARNAMHYKVANESDELHYGDMVEGSFDAFRYFARNEVIPQLTEMKARLEGAGLSDRNGAWGNTVYSCIFRMHSDASLMLSYCDQIAEKLNAESGPKGGPVHTQRQWRDAFFHVCPKDDQFNENDNMRTTLRDYIQVQSEVQGACRQTILAMMLRLEGMHTPEFAIAA